MYISEQPPRNLTTEEIAAYRRDGVICVRQLYSREWVAQITQALDEIVSQPSPIFGARPDTSFHSDVYSWLTNDIVRDFVLFGPSAHIARQALESERITFYYDQIFVKERLSPLPTPWHHDYTFWPIAGSQIASLWTSVDPVDASSSALEFVAGSHLWPQRYRAIGADGTDFTTGEERDELPDIEADRSRYTILSWNLEPGDALLFDALTLHGARGNHSPDTKRRAITTRWCGDDVIYEPKGTMEVHRHELKPGDPLSSSIYPQILPAIIEAQISPRMDGPVLPDPALLATKFAKMSSLDRVEVMPDA